jgi:hypothetical protein
MRRATKDTSVLRFPQEYHDYLFLLHQWHSQTGSVNAQGYFIVMESQPLQKFLIFFQVD